MVHRRIAHQARDIRQTGDSGDGNLGRGEIADLGQSQRVGLGAKCREVLAEGHIICQCNMLDQFVGCHVQYRGQIRHASHREVRRV